MVQESRAIDDHQSGGDRDKSVKCEARGATTLTNHALRRRLAAAETREVEMSARCRELESAMKSALEGHAAVLDKLEERQKLLKAVRSRVAELESELSVCRAQQQKDRTVAAAAAAESGAADVKTSERAVAAALLFENSSFSNSNTH